MARNSGKRWVWMLWLLGTLVLASYYSFRLFASDDKTAFLIGPATHGHHQIELACDSCHSSAFGGGEVLQQACVNCHGTELKDANDSHPRSKFTDPRNADRLEQLDARNCVTCHREHQLEQTGHMGLTLPEDYCFLCHEDIADERPSHQGMGFDTCASAGCHNYHDNKALYEAFLVKNADQPALQAIARIARRSPASLKHGDQFTGPALDAAQADGPAAHPASAILTDWLGTAHAEAGINCSGCHQAATGPAQTGTTDWNDKPGIAVCQSCHASEAAGFFQGKHGMRLAPDLPISLPPMTPAQGRLAFNDDAAHRQLTCNSCHAPHRFDVREAAVESCLGCHADDHSRAYKTSPHFQLWQAETAGQADAGSGVSCATCHLPRELLQVAGHERVVVNHNQNANLRPNEKMIRSVCQSCHGLAFSIDALADPQLIRSNFTGQPARHIESVDMALQREQDQADQ